jgi:cytochrome c5
MYMYFILPLLILTSTINVTKASQQHQFHHPEAFIKKVSGKKDAGKKIYKQFCAMCHANNPLINLGAPTIRVKKDWIERMKQGIDKMLVKIDSGLNAMPPRGGCFECSDDDLKAAIVYMLPTK